MNFCVKLKHSAYESKCVFIGYLGGVVKRRSLIATERSRQGQETKSTMPIWELAFMAKFLGMLS